MSGRHRIGLESPAGHFIDAFLLGNGRLGAALYGRPGTERIDLNLDTLWSGGPIEQSPMPRSGSLDRVRSAVSRRDFTDADAAAVELQSDGWTESYQPAGTLMWTYAAEETVVGTYERVLDIDRAVSSTAFATREGPVELSAFVSAVDGVLVVSVRGACRRHPLVRFDLPHPHRIETVERDGQATTIVTARAPARALPEYVDDGEPIRYGQDQPAPDGSVRAGMGFALVARQQVLPDGEVRLLLTGETGFRGHDRRPRADTDALARVALARLDAACSIDTEALARRHVADFRSFADRSDLDLSASASSAADAAELFFHYGRYLLISSSRPGTAPATLQGIWNVDPRPAWSCNYTTNINVEMNYWAAETLGLGDCHTPLLDLVGVLAKTGADTARAVYGLDGATVHHNTDIWGFSAPVAGRPQWSNWPTGLLWLATHVLAHLQFAGSPVPSRSLEAVESALRFGLGLLVRGAGGDWYVCPSTSPEHPFEIGTAVASVTAGSTMDQELFLHVASQYLEVVGDGGDRTLVAELTRRLPRTALPAVGADGALLEWADPSLRPAEPGHRHYSHLWGLYPGTRITRRGTPAHVAAAAAALAVRRAHGSGHTGWSQAWTACLAARLRDVDLVDEALDALVTTSTSRSLLGLHPRPDWPGGQVFQIDANLGGVAGIVESILQDADGAIALLPSVPRSWSAGSVAGLRLKGGHVVDLAWRDGVPTDLRLTAGRSGPLVLDVSGEIRAAVVGAGDFRSVVVGESGAPGRTRLQIVVEGGAASVISFRAASGSGSREDAEPSGR